MTPLEVSKSQVLLKRNGIESLEIGAQLVYILEGGESLPMDASLMSPREFTTHYFVTWTAEKIKGPLMAPKSSL